MKRILIASILTSILISPMVIFADTLPPGPQNEADILAILNTVTNWVFTIFLAAAVIFILLGAFKFLTSAGDPGKVSSARDNLLYALIGIAVALMAKGFIALVKVILGVT